MDDLDQRMTARVTAPGQVGLPEDCFRQAGLNEGDSVVVTVEDGEVRIRSLLASIRDVQAQARKIFDGSGYTVDRFLAERFEEAALEEEKYEHLAREAAAARKG